MKYGAMNFPVLPVLSEIERIGELNFDYLELAMDPPHAHYSMLQKEEKQIRKALDSAGLEIVCHLPTFVSTADLTDSIRIASCREMTNSLTTAADLGARKVVLHPSAIMGLAPFVFATAKELAFTFFSEIIEAAERFSLVICLENMFPGNMLGVTADDFEEIFSFFPQMKLTFDTGHAHIQDRDGERLSALLSRWGHRIGHMHFSDNNGMRDEHLPPGEGNIDFAKVIEMVGWAGYNDTITLEVFGRTSEELVQCRKELTSAFGSQPDIRSC